MRRLLVALTVLATLMAGASADAHAPARHEKPAKHCVKRRHHRCAKPKKKARRAAPKRAAAPSAPVSAVPTAPTAATPVVALPPVAPSSTPAPVVPTTPPARLQAITREFSVTLSRPSVVAGRAIVEFLDSGEDPHDLHVRPGTGGADVLAFPTAQPSGRTSLSVTLAAGSYTLYCSLPGHESLGMHATLVVQ